MNPTIISQLKNSWYKKRSDLMQKRRPRRYLHFDKPILSLKADVVNFVTDSTKIETHSFFPLINAPKSERVYKKNADTKIKIVQWKERPISYASHVDSMVYSWYAHQLEFFYEKKLIEANLSDCIIAYRALGKSNIDFAFEVFDFIKKHPEYSTIALDIKGFYDNLDFREVKSAWKEVLGLSDLPKDHYMVFKSITNYAYVRIREIYKLLKIGSKDYRKSTFFLNIEILEQLRDNRKIKKNKIKGIPQGTPISCVISNLYMFSFDKEVFNKVHALGGLYRRYSDDIMIVCPKSSVADIETFVQKKITALKLEIQKTKTEIRFFTKNSGELLCSNEKGRPSKFQYLGIEFDGNKTLLRHKGYARYERRMKKVIGSKYLKSKSEGKPFFKRKIYEKYSSFGQQNYLSYARRAAATLISRSILKQIADSRIMKKIKNIIKSHKK